MKLIGLSLFTLLLVFAYKLGSQPLKTMPLTNTDHSTFPLRVQASTLVVHSVAALRDFYTAGLGFDILYEDRSNLALGKNDKIILYLQEDPKAIIPPSSSVGLYHNAFVYQDGAYLAERLAYLQKNYASLFEGSANHTVSLAFYLHDPEGNGIELYWDTPDSTWTKDSAGEVEMGTTYLDPQEFINKYSGAIQSKNIYLGHIHLKVSDIKLAKSFYVDTLGLTIKKQTPDALFLASGGYHHHIGVNVWQSAGSPKKTPGTTGLVEYILHASPEAFARIEANLPKAKPNYMQDDKPGVTILTDPWGVQVKIVQSN